MRPSRLSTLIVLGKPFRIPYERGCTTTVSAPCQNELLLKLHADVQLDTVSQLKPIKLKVGATIYEPGAKLRYVYFVESGIVSAVTLLQNGSIIESGLIGREEMVGIPLILSLNNSNRLYFVQADCHLLQMTANKFVKALSRHPSFSRLLMQYSGVTASRVMQLAACNAKHSIKAVLPLAFDVAGSITQLQITHHAGIIVAHAGYPSFQCL